MGERARLRDILVGVGQHLVADVPAGDDREDCLDYRIEVARHHLPVDGLNACGANADQPLAGTHAGIGASPTLR